MCVVSVKHKYTINIIINLFFFLGKKLCTEMYKVNFLFTV